MLLVIIITGIGIFYTVVVHKKVTIMTLVFCLSCLIVFAGLAFTEQKVRKLELMEQQLLSSDIEGQASLTNGLYSVLAVRKSPAGGYLAVLQPAVITDLDVNSRSVAYTNVGRLPRIINLDAAIAAPDNVEFTGFAEVFSGSKGPEIRDFRPFRFLPSPTE